MAIEKFSEVGVLCDHYGKGGRCLAGDSRWDTIGDAVWDLRNEGWTVGRKVLCPEHARRKLAVITPPGDTG